MPWVVPPYFTKTCTFSESARVLESELARTLILELARIFKVQVQKFRLNLQVRPALRIYGGILGSRGRLAFWCADLSCKQKKFLRTYVRPALE